MTENDSWCRNYPLYRSIQQRNLILHQIKLSFPTNELRSEENWIDLDMRSHPNSSPGRIWGASCHFSLEQARAKSCSWVCVKLPEIRLYLEVFTPVKKRLEILSVFYYILFYHLSFRHEYSNFLVLMYFLKIKPYTKKLHNANLFLLLI